MSTDAASKKTIPQDLDSLGLAAYFDAVADNNPFAANRVSEPSSHDVDVPSINGNEFDQIIKLANRAYRQKTSVGTMLYGEAGSGKSHLLSRLYRWATKEDRASYVFLHNVVSDPDRYPRYILKCVVSVLSQGGRRPLSNSPLYRLVYEAIGLTLKQENITTAKRKQCEEHYARLVERSAESWHVRDPAANRKIHSVLFQLFWLAYPRPNADPQAEVLAESIVQWLSGEEIEPEAARKIGLTVTGDSPVMLRDEEIEQVILALAQLSLVRGRPFILCLDQIEQLDLERIQSLAVFLHLLIDHAVNLHVIISGVKELLLRLDMEKIISRATWDRLAEYQVTLLPIRQEDVRRIIEARLEKFHESFIGLQPIKQKITEDTIFPLGGSWLAERLGNGLDFSPRQILTWARDGWDRQQSGLAKLGGQIWLKQWPSTESPPDPPELDLLKVIDEAVDRKIEESIAQRRLHKGSLPPDAGNLAGLVESLLEHCRGEGLPYTFREAKRKAKVKGKLPPFDLEVREEREKDRKAITSGVQFVTNEGRSATESLKRLLTNDSPPDHRILVTDEERRPLKLNRGSQGAEYYADLVKLGPAKFEHIKLDFKTYAALDALASVVQLAASGDLDVEYPRGTIRRVTAEEVIASHHRRDRYRNHPLLRPMLTEDPPLEKPAGPTSLMLNEPDVRSHIMAQLAWRLMMSCHEVTKGYLQVKPALKIEHAAALAQVKEIASRMHEERLIHATPHDSDLSLMKRA